MVAASVAVDITTILAAADPICAAHVTEDVGPISCAPQPAAASPHRVSGGCRLGHLITPGV